MAGDLNNTSALGRCHDDVDRIVHSENVAGRSFGLSLWLGEPWKVPQKPL